jgi:outer membrane protein assembly factor BamB
MTYDPPLCETRPVDLRKLRRARWEWRRSPVVDESTRRLLRTALDTESQPPRSEAIGAVADLAAADPGVATLLSEQTPVVRPWSFPDESGRSGSETGPFHVSPDEVAFLTLFREVPTATRLLFDSLITEGETLRVERSALGAVAGRGPAVLKPVVPTMARTATDGEPYEWLLTRLWWQEPALLRRHVANCLWTVDQALETNQSATAALDSLRTAGRITTAARPDVAQLRSLLERPDKETRWEAARTLVGIAARHRGDEWGVGDWGPVLDVVSEQFDDVDVNITSDREVHRYLRVLAGLDESAARRVLRLLSAGLGGNSTDCLIKLLSIERVLADVPTLAAPETAMRVAVFLAADPPDVVKAALDATAAHGRVAVDTLGLAPVVELLGHGDQEVRERTVRALLSLGMCTPGSRAEIVQALGWSVYDETVEVRREAAAALGTAGRTWPSTAPQAVDLLVGSLVNETDAVEATATALVDIAEAHSAVPRFVQRLLSAARNGNLDRSRLLKCLQGIAERAPEAVDSTLDYLVEAASLESADGGETAARALVGVARGDPDSLSDPTGALRSILETGRTSSTHWALVATALGLVTAAEAGHAPQTEWLSKRFPEEPLAFGPALARLAGPDPETTLPALEGLLATIERSDGAIRELDVERALTDVVGPLLEEAGPAAAVPVVRTLAAALSAPPHRSVAATLLADAIDTWPYVAPYAERAVLTRLEDGDAETLASLSTVLGHMWSDAARDALAELTHHPEAAVRSAARDARPAPPTTTEAASASSKSSPAAGADPVTASTVDAVAGRLGDPAAPGTTAAVETLGRLGCRHPSLRDRCLGHLVGWLGAVAEVGSLDAVEAATDGALGAATREAISQLAPGDGSGTGPDAGPGITSAPTPTPTSECAPDDDPESVPDDDPESVTDDDRPDTVVRRLFGICHTADTVGRAQALTVLPALVRERPAEAEHAVEHVRRVLDRDGAAGGSDGAGGGSDSGSGNGDDDGNTLVTARALRSLGDLAEFAPQAAGEAVPALESYLFRPHVLVPTATWTVGELATVAPDRVDAIAESLTGLVDWGPLDRYHATGTIRRVLAVVPDTESTLAPTLIDRLGEQCRDASLDLVEAVGLLSGTTLAETDGAVAALVAYLNEDTDPPVHVGVRAETVVADRLLRVTPERPRRVLRAINETGMGLNACAFSHSGPYFLKTVERLLASGVDTRDLSFDPLAGVLWAYFDNDAGRAWVSDNNLPVYELLINTDDIQWRQLGASLLARTGHRGFLAVLDAYESLPQPVRPDADLIVEFFRRCDVAEVRTDAAESLGDDVPESVLTATTAEAAAVLIDEREPTAASRRVLDALPMLIEQLPASTTLDPDPVAVLTDYLATESVWETRLAAVDALAELGASTGQYVPAGTVVELLRETLGDPDSDPAIRAKAAAALAEVTVEAVLALAPVVDDLCDAVRDDGRAAAGRCGPAIALGKLGAREPGVRDRVVRILAETLDGCADTGRALLKRRLIEALTTIAEVDPGAVAPHVGAVASRLDDPGGEVRTAAVEWLELVGAAEGVSDGTRARACALLGTELDADGAARRSRALGALTTIAEVDPGAAATQVDAVASRLDDRDREIRTAAVEWLELVGAAEGVSDGTLKRACTYISNALDADSAVQRERAIDVLRSIAGVAPATVGRHCNRIVDRLNDTAPGVRSAANACLDRIALAPETPSDQIDRICICLARLLWTSTDQPDTRTAVLERLVTLARVAPSVTDQYCDRIVAPLDEPGSTPAVHQVLVVRCLSHLDVGATQAAIRSVDLSDSRVDRAVRSARARLRGRLGAELDDPVTGEARRIPAAGYRRDAGRTGTASTGSAGFESVETRWTVDGEEQNNWEAIPICVDAEHLSSVTGRSLVLVSTGHRLVGFDSADGRLVGSTHLESRSDSLESLFENDTTAEQDSGPPAEPNLMTVESVPPAVVGATAFVVTRTRGIVAVDLRTWMEVDAVSCDWDWQSPVPDDSGPVTVYSPVVDDGTVYVATDTGVRVAALYAAGGTAWDRSGGPRGDSEEGLGSPPAVLDGTVYVRDGTRPQRLYAHAAADGRQLWQFDLGRDSSVQAPATAADDTVYVAGRNTVFALRAATGEELWATEVGRNDLAKSAALAVDGSRVYLGGGGGEVTALDASDGTRAWRFRTDGSAPMPPVVVDRTVYVATTGGLLHALDAETGTERWGGHPMDSILAPPAVHGDSLYLVGDIDGSTTVRALGTPE